MYSRQTLGDFISTLGILARRAWFKITACYWAFANYRRGREERRVVTVDVEEVITIVAVIQHRAQSPSKHPLTMSSIQPLSTLLSCNAN